MTFSVGLITGPDGNPMGQVTLTRVWAGYLPVPRALLQSWMARQVPAMTEAVRRMVELQFGQRDIVKAAPIVQQILQGVGEGRSFPLQYKVDKKEFVIKELRVDDGLLTVVLAPLKPAATTSQPAATQ